MAILIFDWIVVKIKLGHSKKKCKVVNCVTNLKQTILTFASIIFIIGEFAHFTNLNLGTWYYKLLFVSKGNQAQQQQPQEFIVCFSFDANNFGKYYKR